jgi:hypothetical protein
MKTLVLPSGSAREFTHRVDNPAAGSAALAWTLQRTHADRRLAGTASAARRESGKTKIVGSVTWTIHNKLRGQWQNRSPPAERRIEAAAE